MSNVIPLNQSAPNFSLKNFQGEEVQLSTYRGHKHILLVFNRGFT